MKRILLFSLLVGLMSVLSAKCQAQNLLSNPGLDVLDSAGNPDPFLYYDEPVAWDVVTDPCSYSPCAIIPYSAGNPYTPYAGYTAGFADRVAPNVGKGFVGAAFEGRYPGEVVGAVDAGVKQAVPGIVGQKYLMSGWAHYEAGYAGGVDFINPLSPSARAGLPSETRTYFALEFLDGVGTVLPGSIEWELRQDDGQTNDPTSNDGSRVWQQHVRSAVAPLGTVSVQVRAMMIDGEFNVDLPGGAQAVYFDDFSLTAVPEPTTALLGLLGLVGVGLVHRARK